MTAGWKDRLVGRQVPASDYYLLRDTVGMKPAALRRLRDAPQRALDQRVAAKDPAAGAAATASEQKWQEVAGITGSLPKRARRRRRGREVVSVAFARRPLRASERHPRRAFTTLRAQPC